METKALDAKLRARGSKKLSAELDALFKPVIDRIVGAGGSIPLPHTAEGATAEAPDTATDALDAARQALETHLGPIYEQQEVDAFIANVDGLKKQIAELDPR